MRPLSKGTYLTAIFTKCGSNISNTHSLVAMDSRWLCFVLSVFTECVIVVCYYFFFLLSLFVFTCPYSLRKLSRILEMKIGKSYSCNFFQEVLSDMIYVFDVYIFTNVSHFSINIVVSW